MTKARREACPAVVEAEFLAQEVIDLAVGEAAVRYHRDPHPLRHHGGEERQQLVFMVVAPILQLGACYGLPHQRCASSVAGLHAQHEHALVGVLELIFARRLIVPRTGRDSPPKNSSTVSPSAPKYP
jgi:hypothetical protein